MRPQMQSEIEMMASLIAKEPEEQSDMTTDRITALSHAITLYNAANDREMFIQLCVLKKLIREGQHNGDCFRAIDSITAYFEKKHHITGQDVLGGFA